VAILVMMLLPAFPIKADEVYIDIDMDGDAYVNVENTNGTFAIWYNGRDILKELEDYYDQVADYQVIIAHLGAKAKYADDLGEEIDELNEKLNDLVSDLNGAFGLISGDMRYIYDVVGVSGNSTDIVESLKGLNSTVAGYIEDIIVSTNEIETKYSEITSEIEARYSELTGEIADFTGATGSQIMALEKETEQAGVDIESLQTEFAEREMLWQRAMEQVNSEIEEMKMFETLTYGVYAMFIAFSVIVTLLNYIMLRK